MLIYLIDKYKKILFPVVERVRIPIIENVQVQKNTTLPLF